MYATKLAASGAKENWNEDYHGAWSTTGLDYNGSYEKNPNACPRGSGDSQPECCGGYDSPFFLYNTLNTNKQCCADGTVQKTCPAY